MSFPFYRQLNTTDCGPTCLRMIAKYYGRHYNAETLRNKIGLSKEGISLLGLSDIAEQIGFRTRGIRVDYVTLQEMPLPCILHWDQNHFVILLKISANNVKVADPAKGTIVYVKKEFLKYWIPSNNLEINQTGLALLLEPTPDFFQMKGEKENKISWNLIIQYLKNVKIQIIHVFFAIVITSLLQLGIPFLTQSIVDVGINLQNLNYVTAILIAQLVLTFSQSIVGFVQGRLLLKISSFLNVQILSDFWIKLIRLPVSYFDAHHKGDTLQRLDDHKNIQNFLTGSTIITIVSSFTFLIYSIVLMSYNIGLFIVFAIGSLTYFMWIQLFMKIRRKINYQTFEASTKEKNASLQLVEGMQEIRLNNAGKLKRWEWENIQASIFRLNFKSLHYSQWQSFGAMLINQTQNIIISYIVAKMVIERKLTLGSMIAIQYIIGQLSAPISQWIGFIQNAQDAKISMERLNEIHNLSEEEDPEKNYIQTLSSKSRSISVKKLSFKYPAGEEYILDGINLSIPHGKVIAIVGVSGSGKTTLLKILLKIYEQYEGSITIGDLNRTTHEAKDNHYRKCVNFHYLSHQYWRNICGAVMQEGYIFNDSIAKNIAIGENEIDYEKLANSCRIANISQFIESLPNGFYTQLGSEGIGLSSGQKQRLLIARAVYKNPEYLFFDEATNSLDANNEREIVENLVSFFAGKTVVIVAHRLSTVKNADKIVVLDKGKVVEEGTHDTLSLIRGKYYQLVKNQLELGT